MEKSLAELFTEAFPYYLSMGMTYDEFWNGPPSLVRAYRQAWAIKQKNDEFDRWRRGMYVYDAILRASPVLRPFGKGEVKPMDYPDRPYPLTEKEAKEQEAQRERENFFAYLKRMEAESERNKQKREDMKKQEVKENAEY